MKKLTTIIFFCCFINALSAQRPIDELVNAERRFAAYSVANGTKDAFLNFLDSAGIIFQNGLAVNGIQSWNKREKRPGILNWRPQYAGIAQSNDFGYTTGPWTFQQSINDTIAARGQYTTVWHKNKNGEWKFLVDLGVGGTPAPINNELSFTGKTKKRGGSLNSLLEREKKFIKDNADSPKGGYEKPCKGNTCLDALSPASLLSRNGMRPQIGSWPDEIFPAKVQYTILGSGISSSGDLGYVYGTTIINGKTDNYLRIWQREKDGWKIAVEVLRY